MAEAAQPTVAPVVVWLPRRGCGAPLWDGTAALALIIDTLRIYRWRT